MKKEETFDALMESIFELSRAYHDYQNKPRTYGTDDELFMVEVHVLNLIGEHGKLNVTQLSKKTNRTKGAVCQIIDKLINKGLVNKYKNPVNFREVKLELSEKGNKIYNYHKLVDKKKNEKILLELSDFSINDFKKYTKINNTVSQYVKKIQEM